MESNSKMVINTVKIYFGFKWQWKCVEDISHFFYSGHSADTQRRNASEIGKNVTFSVFQVENCYIDIPSPLNATLHSVPTDANTAFKS